MIVIALLVPLALAYGGILMLRDRSATGQFATDQEESTVPENGELLYAKRL